MAWENRLYNIPGLTCASSADLSTSQYSVVKLVGDAEVDKCTAVSDVPIGVLQNEPDSGEAAEVMGAGVTKLKVGSSWSAGDSLGVSSEGLGQSVTISSTASDASVIGQAMEGSGAADSIGTALINCLAPINNSAN